MDKTWLYFFMMCPIIASNKKCIFNKDISTMASDSKSKLLLSAFEEFAKNGFSGASTRDIAAKANINISSILYYFGGKKGIYTAALKKIVDTVNTFTAELTNRYQEVIQTKDATEARKFLKEMLSLFLTLVCSKEISDDVKKVFLSEYSSPSDEFNILYDELIRPVHDRMATLLNLASGGKIRLRDCYFYIIPLFSQLFVFASREEFICRLMDWKGYTKQAEKKLLNYINAQVDFILDYPKQ